MTKDLLKTYFLFSLIQLLFSVTERYDLDLKNVINHEHTLPYWAAEGISI